MKGKKSVAIIVLCLVIAIAVILVTRPKDSMKIPDMKGRTTWMKCGDPSCSSSYEIELNQYYEELKERQKASLGFGRPGIMCEKCAKDTSYKALKCENCDTIFIEGFMGRSDFSDRCTECNFSKIEEQRSKQ